MDNQIIIISRDSFFEGDIIAEHIAIGGKVIGDITAQSSILIKESGWVEGDINAPTIYLAKGCHHEGAIYLDSVENASSAKINMNDLKFYPDNNDEIKPKEGEMSKEQSVSTEKKSISW